MLYCADQYYVAAKISRLSEWTKKSLITSENFQGRNSITGVKHKGDIENCTDNHVSHYIKLNVYSIEYFCKIFFNEKYGKTIKTIFPSLSLRNIVLQFM